VWVSKLGLARMWWQVAVSAVIILWPVILAGGMLLYERWSV
jgi:hypothetical protein